MKRTLRTVVCLILAAMIFLALPFSASAASKQASVFTKNDIDTLVKKYKTVQNYVDALKPSAYAWYYEGDATGESFLSMKGTGYIVELKIMTAGGTINGEYEDSSYRVKKLPSTVRTLDARISGISWTSKSFATIATPRGVKIGATKAQVRKAYKDICKADTMYTIKDVNPKASESWLAYTFIGGGLLPKGDEENQAGADVLVYTWCTPLKAADEWREYYSLTYALKNDKVTSIEFNYWTDAE